MDLRWAFQFSDESARRVGFVLVRKLAQRRGGGRRLRLKPAGFGAQGGCILLKLLLRIRDLAGVTRQNGLLAALVGELGRNIRCDACIGAARCLLG